ncbi:MAG: hypothetical protein K2F99_09895, partial [Muribaculaceae bacterium]|nr:hypothetical protein [Muribaculaceae bacterium]
VPPEAANLPNTLDAEGDDLILGDASPKSTAELGTEGFSEETLILGTSAMQRAEGLPEDVRKTFLGELVPQITDYKKELVTKYGFTPEEAMTAGFTRADKLVAEKYDNWRKENPDAVIVTIDKSQEKNLELTDEERLKLQRAKSLKLILVEAQDLETLEIDPHHERVDMPAMREICGTLSQYSIPLLSFGDYATFRGAQSGILATCTSSKDDTMLDSLEKKATLLYNQFRSSLLIRKRRDDGSIMSYEDFCNLYHYEDIDMGVYAVVTASAMEVTETMYVCQNRRCQRPYQISYNQKALLDLSGIPDEFKKRVDTIDAARSSYLTMQKIHEECCKATRVKSPLTKNVYEIYSPTIAEARALLDACQDSVDASTAMDLVLLLYVRFIWVYNTET